MATTTVTIRLTAINDAKKTIDAVNNGIKMIGQQGMNSAVITTRSISQNINAFCKYTQEVDKACNDYVNSISSIFGQETPLL